jgi:hypothetical protein
VAVFAVGGVGDLLWHQVFGIEQGIAALLSPTHLLLFTGIALLLLAPFRAAWSAPEPPPAGLLGLLPALLSITLLTALVAFFFGYTSLFSIDLAFPSGPVSVAQDQAPQLVGVFDAWAQDIQIKGIMAALSTSLIVVAPVLLMLRRWRLPFGAAVDRQGPPDAGATGTRRARPARTNRAPAWRRRSQGQPEGEALHDDHLPRWQEPGGSRRSGGQARLSRGCGR